MQGIIVQDLKPSNVLLDERQQLFIADYGLAANLEASIMSTRSSVAHAGGTEAYMAPEQYDSDGFGKVSGKTDVWALGCILLEMLTGNVPWSGKRRPEIMMNLVMKRQAPPIPDDLPGELGAVLGGCFAHSQAERSSAAEVAAALAGTGAAPSSRRSRRRTPKS